MIENEPEVETVSCPCGASVEVDLGGREPVVACPECGMSLKVVVTLDPRTGKKRVGILVSPLAVVPTKPKEKAPPKRAKPGGPVGVDMFKPLCACGAEVIVDFRSVDSVFTCGWCGASYMACLKEDPESGEQTASLMPVQVVPLTKEKPKTVRRVVKPAEPPKAKTARKAAAEEKEEAPAESPLPTKSRTLRAAQAAKKEAARKEAEKEEVPAESPLPTKSRTLRAAQAAKKEEAEPPPSEPEKAEAKTAGPAAVVPGKESLLLTARGAIGAQALKIDEEGSRISCFCGKEIVLGEESSNRILRCLECRLSFRVIFAVEPRTKKPMVITLPRSPLPPQGKGN